MFQALIVWVQQEVLEAVRDVMIGQELQIVLIKLKLQRMLLQNLQRREQTNKDKDGEKGSVCMCVCVYDSWTVSLFCGFVSHHSRDDQLETGKSLSCARRGKGGDIITARHNPDWARRTTAPLFPSSGVRWPMRKKKCWIFEATWAYWKKQQLFWRWGTSIFSFCPNPLSPVYSSPDPRTPAKLC